MEKYKWKATPKNLSYEEESKAYNKQLIDSMMLVKKQLDEIKSIFNAQLEKPGDERRQFAVEQIIQYLYTNPMNKYEMLEEPSSYTMTLIDLADIVDSANKNDAQAFAEKLEMLPWGDSNTGDQIAQNTTEFAYWILSDESRNQLLPVFENVIANKIDSKRHPSVQLGKFDTMVRLYNLEEYNSKTAAELANVKSQQGQE